MTKYIFVVGGVMSGIGKGVATASIGRLLKDRGFKVTAVKIDPYINVDAGTMNPIEHGEVFVTEDGLECDQDIGNYERFLDQDIPRENYLTTGLVYQTVINRERNLEYGGKCVEVVPHIPEEVIRRLGIAAKKSKADFVLVEIGGTVGEYQNLLFLEAGRMMKLKNPTGVVFVLVSYLPIPALVGEMKTKPTQYAVRSLNMAGIQPDIILARSAMSLDQPRKEKISTFCNIAPEDVISAPDVDIIYKIPVNFEKERLSDRILKKFNLRPRRKRNHQWLNFYRKIQKSSRPVKIGIVGKYFQSGNFTFKDSYISLLEAIKHAAWHFRLKPQIEWLNAEMFEEQPLKLALLKNYQGIIVPGGYGSRGVEGKIRTIKYVREHKIPFLGLCYGLQLSIVELIRHLAGLKQAHTTEVDKNTKHPVVHLMPEQIENVEGKKLGGSMRLGTQTCRLKKGSLAWQIYGQSSVFERHRHRFVFNNDYRQDLESSGAVISGLSSKNQLEIIELKDHPFFLGTQFHPEFKSRPLLPHPIFMAFIKAAKQK